MSQYPCHKISQSFLGITRAYDHFVHINHLLPAIMLARLPWSLTILLHVRIFQNTPLLQKCQIQVHCRLQITMLPKEATFMLNHTLLEIDFFLFFFRNEECISLANSVTWCATAYAEYHKVCNENISICSL